MGGCVYICFPPDLSQEGSSTCKHANKILSMNSSFLAAASEGMTQKTKQQIMDFALVKH